ncbi:MAG: hypothetical protein ACD_51C00265G0004, partial [uncultured bacterium]
ADFEPEKIPGKIKKDGGGRQITLNQTIDILKWCGGHKESQVVVGFALETDHLEDRTRAKMVEKKCDFMVGNLISNIGSDMGECIVFGKDSKIGILGSKSDLALRIWDFIAA